MPLGSAVLLRRAAWSRAATSNERLREKVELLDAPDRKVSAWRLLMMMSEHEIGHRSQIAAINRKKTQRILWYESIGFILLIVLSWLNELISLPHLLFGSGEHSNLHEAIMETSVLFLVWAVVFLFTRRLLAPGVAGVRPLR